MKPKIYIFSIFPWESNLLHREHMLAKSFAKLGYEVCFVERSYSKLFSAKTHMVDNIEIVTVFGLPYLKGYFHSIFKINDWLIARQLTKFINTGEDSWFILSSPLWAKVVYKVNKSSQKYVYDISDDHLNFATNDIWRKNLKIYEDYAIEKADLVTLTSENLLSKLPTGKKHVIVENGVDLESSSSAKPILRERYKGKIVGFIGGVYKRVDLGLVEKCAIAYPDTDFVVIGPTDQGGKIDDMKKISNFHYLGPVAWNEVQDYFASFDVGIIPFVSEAEYPWLKTVDSVKIYQYAYFGYPIVVTNYGQVKKLIPAVSVADTKEEFVTLVGESVAGKESTAIKEKRKQLAKEHDWTKLAEQMAENVIR